MSDTELMCANCGQPLDVGDMYCRACGLPTVHAHTLRARAAALPAGPQRTRVERCATMATVAGDGALLLDCAAQLPR